MQRARLYDLRMSDFPQSLGLCTGDTAAIAQYVNTAQRRLVYAKEAAEEGWWGGWAEMAFSNVSRTNPYVTTPRGVARIEAFDICTRPVVVQNQFYEYLQFGNGRLPKARCRCNGPTMSYTRNNAITFTEMASPSYIALFPTDAADVQANARVLVQGNGSNDSTVYSQDGFNQVSGIFVSLASPFATTPMIFNSLSGIQKDVTVGPVRVVAIDAVTGAQTLLLTMEPGETTASYRRYYLATLPNDCCGTPQGTPPQPLTVTAIAKLDLIPVVVDTDYLLIQNIEALTMEAMAVRFSRMDTQSAKAQAQENHIEAIRLLIGECRHFLGDRRPAVSFKPFGSARLSHQRIGMI